MNLDLFDNYFSLMLVILFVLLLSREQGASDGIDLVGDRTNALLEGF
jgi:hypothetical protein